MAQFKNISYGFLLYETLRNHFSINRDGDLSILYRYLLCCLYVLQAPWDAYNVWRIQKKIIAGCYYEVGQLENVLNYFFDPIANGIYITQKSYLACYVPKFTHAYTPPPADESDVFVPTFADESTTYVPTFSTPIISSGVIIHVPAAYAVVGSAEYNALVAVIEQIKITGLNYSIISL